MRDIVRSRLWPIPLLAIIAGVVLGVGLVLLDGRVDDHLPGWADSFVFAGGSDAARAVLSAIAGSLISAASLTFSLTVVALQLATNQGSPRLLRMFASDWAVQATLGTFLGTFALSLTVLRTVEDATEGAAAFVPRIAMTTATLLTLVSIVVLTLFLAHLARQLRIETMMRDVHREASQTIALADAGELRRADDAPVPVGEVHTVFAPASGFLTGVDRAGLVRIARENGIVVRELRTVGANVIEGTPLVDWWRAHAAECDPDTDDDTDEISDRLRAEYRSAYERTPSQDVGFGLRQLADIAIKALSPGVNDPTTAVHALGHISALLADLAQGEAPPAAYADEDGAARLIPIGDGFDALVDVALSGVRRYGAGDTDVALRLIQVLGDLTWRVRTDAQRGVIAAHLARVERSLASQDYDDVERARFAVEISAVRARL